MHVFHEVYSENFLWCLCSLFYFIRRYSKIEKVDFFHGEPRLRISVGHPPPGGVPQKKLTRRPRRGSRWSRWMESWVEILAKNQIALWPTFDAESKSAKNQLSTFPVYSRGGVGVGPGPSFQLFMLSPNLLKTKFPYVQGGGGWGSRTQLPTFDTESKSAMNVIFYIAPV